MHPGELPAELTEQDFEIAVRKLADDLRYGPDPSRYVGSGIDYAQSRPFAQGDPIKDIDWRVTARTGRYHVKEYEVLKSTPVYLVVDTSASMAFSSQATSKHVLATLLAGGLGIASLARLSPVGVLDAAERDLHFQPSLSRARLFQWLHELRHRRFDEKTQLAKRLEQLGELLPVRSLVITISDLHDPAAIAAVKKVAQRHDMIVLHLEDPAEQGLAGGGIFRGQEAETGRQFVAHGRTRWFGEERSVDRDLRGAGIDYLHLSTDKPFVPAVRRLMMNRGQMHRNAR